MFQWHDLLTAIALVLILEGIMPFANPAGLRRAMQAISQLSDQQLRITGVVSMIGGLVIMYFVN